MSIPQTVIAAARRARTIAAIARTRAAGPAPIPNAAGRTALTEIAALLDTAALALETQEPDTWDGIVITNTIDWDAMYALHNADDIAADNPATGFPPRFSQYVTAPVFGTGPELPASLLPGGPVLIAQEGDLFARLLAVHAELKAAPVDEDVTTRLEAAFRLLWKHAQLADSIAVDVARTGNRPATPAVVEIPAPDTATALRRAHDEHGPTLTYGLKDRRLPCHSGEHERPFTANRMVSHLGVTIPSCDTHTEAAAVAARELYDLS